MILATITFLATTVAAIYALYKRRKVLRQLKKDFVIPPFHRFLGHLPDFYKRELPDVFQILLGFFKLYGKTILLIGPLYISTVLISEPSDVEVLLANANSRSAKKSVEYDFLRPWLGNGLLTSYGDKWYQRRKIITPAFHFNILERFVEVMTRQSEILVKKLELNMGKSSFNISDYVTLFTLDVICVEPVAEKRIFTEASMGITLNAQSEPNSKYVQSVEQISSIIFARIFKPSQRIPGCFFLTRDGRMHWRLKRYLHKFTSNVITNRRLKLASGEFEPEKRLNFMDMLLCAQVEGKPLSNNDIREEVDTFMFEGHDTTTSALSFVLYQLSRHQDIQDRVYEEVCEIYEKNPDAQMTYIKLLDMKYLDTVIKETLRIMPPVPLFGRLLTEEVQIGDKILPVGTNVVVCVYAMHHDPDLFPEPEKFDPERFNLSNYQTRHPFAFIPFSAGARNCIGQKFAMLELKTAVSKIIMAYRILPDSNNRSLSMIAALILKSQNGVYIRLEKR